MKRQMSDLALYAVTAAVGLALVLWLRWMIVAPYWLEVFGVGRP